MVIGEGIIPFNFQVMKCKYWLHRQITGNLGFNYKYLNQMTRIAMKFTAYMSVLCSKPPRGAISSLILHNELIFFFEKVMFILTFVFVNDIF